MSIIVIAGFFLLLSVVGVGGIVLIMRDSDPPPPRAETEDADINDKANDLLDEIYDEWQSARQKFGPFASAHEGLSVFEEEAYELMLEVYKNEAKHPDRNALMRKEAIQVAAMALRFLTDCCKHESTPEPEPEPEPEPRTLDIVFDGPPDHNSGRFVEVEDEHGNSVNIGEWIDRGNGLWALRISRAD